jgi:hypothetical protein
MGGQLHAPATLPPEKIPGNNYIGGWVGSSFAPTGIRSPDRPVQPVASRYTDYAIPDYTGQLGRSYDKYKTVYKNTDKLCHYVFLEWQMTAVQQFVAGRSITVSLPTGVIIRQQTENFKRLGNLPA